MIILSGVPFVNFLGKLSQSNHGSTATIDSLNILS